MSINFRRVLILAPHTDDGEIGCGGTIARLIEEGKEVHYLAFSSARKSLREQGKPEDLLIKEVRSATRVLGIKPENLQVLDFDVREFDKCRQGILDVLIKARKEIEPDLVLAPSLHDIHQDHAVVAREALRAFKNVTILGYEMPWNNIEFQTRVFVKLSLSQLETKVRALGEYESQAHRSYLDHGFIKALSKTRGVQIESENAEAFEVMRLVF